MARPGLDQATIAKIIELRRTGMSVKDIANAIPISIGSVKKQLKEAGITLTAEQSQARYQKQGAARAKRAIDGKFACSACGELKLPEEFHTDKNRPNGLVPACKACAVEYYQKNREVKIAKRKEYREKNPDACRGVDKKIYKQKKTQYKARASKWRENNHERKLEIERKSGRKHQGKKNARTAKYRADKLQATPPWLTKAQKKQIQDMYVEARRLFEETGVKYHVDHIHALHGLTEDGYAFSGLHVPWNLEVVHWRANLKKGRIHRV